MMGSSFSSEYLSRSSRMSSSAWMFTTSPVICVWLPPETVFTTLHSIVSFSSLITGALTFSAFVIVQPTSAILSWS